MSHIIDSPVAFQDSLVSCALLDLVHTAEDEAWLATLSEGGCRPDELSPDEIAFLALARAWEPDAEFDAWMDAHDAFIGGFES